MKTRSFLFASALVLLTLACGKTPEPDPQPQPQPQPQVVAVSSVSLNKTTLTLEVGASETLTATVKPDNATDKTVTWSTSNAAVATVSGGKVVAVQVGEATITAKAGEKEASCKVTVNAAVVAVESVTLDKTAITLAPSQSETLTATVAPEDATDKTVTWSTSNATVATVANGVVTARQDGEATITAKAGEKEATCKVTVITSTIEVLDAYSTDAAILNGAGGETVITLSADADWSVSSDSDWLTVSPSSGSAGAGQITVTTAANNTTSGRTGILTLTSNGGKQSMSVLQRPYVFTRTKIKEGDITNSIKLTYSGKPTRTYCILPIPQDNQYQEITNLNVGTATQKTCPDGVNRYLIQDLDASQIPASGQYVASETFHSKAYKVSVNLSRISDIPEYDQESEVCKKYLGKEDGDLVNPEHSEIVSVANTLWGEASGNLIDYARKCYEWTAQNMTYGNMNTGLHTITDLMKTKKGDCGNFSSVFISLLRAKGIPARHVVMISPTESGYHVRAEFYIPAYGWIPADPTFRNSDPLGDYFGIFTGPYVVMSFGVNSIVELWDGNYVAQLMQGALHWIWGASGFQFTHTFTNFK